MPVSSCERYAEVLFATVDAYDATVRAKESLFFRLVATLASSANESEREERISWIDEALTNIQRITQGDKSKKFPAVQAKLLSACSVNQITREHALMVVELNKERTCVASLRAALAAKEQEKRKFAEDSQKREDAIRAECRERISLLQAESQRAIHNTSVSLSTTTSNPSRPATSASIAVQVQGLLAEKIRDSHVEEHIQRLRCHSEAFEQLGATMSAFWSSHVASSFRQCVALNCHSQSLEREVEALHIELAECLRRIASQEAGQLCAACASTISYNDSYIPPYDQDYALFDSEAWSATRGDNFPVQLTAPRTASAQPLGARGTQGRSRGGDRKDESTCEDRVSTTCQTDEWESPSIAESLAEENQKLRVLMFNLVAVTARELVTL